MPKAAYPHEKKNTRSFECIRKRTISPDQHLKTSGQGKM